jgi:hypothetical protein
MAVSGVHILGFCEIKYSDFLRKERIKRGELNLNSQTLSRKKAFFHFIKMQSKGIAIGIYYSVKEFAGISALRTMRII